MASLKTTTPSMIDVKEVATILSVSTRTVWRLVSSDQLPRPIRFGRNVRWRLADIERWIESEVRATADRGGAHRFPR